MIGRVGTRNEKDEYTEEKPRYRSLSTSRHFPLILVVFSLSLFLFRFSYDVVAKSTSSRVAGRSLDGDRGDGLFASSTSTEGMRTERSNTAPLRYEQRSRYTLPQSTRRRVYIDKRTQASRGRDRDNLVRGERTDGACEERLEYQWKQRRRERENGRTKKRSMFEPCLNGNEEPVRAIFPLLFSSRFVFRTILSWCVS